MFARTPLAILGLTALTTLAAAQAPTPEMPVRKSATSIDVICGTSIHNGDSQDAITKPGTRAEAWCPLGQPRLVVLGGYCQYKHALDEKNPDAIGPSKAVARQEGTVIQHGWECVVPNTLKDPNPRKALKLVAHALCGVVCEVPLSQRGETGTPGMPGPPGPQGPQGPAGASARTQVLATADGNALFDCGFWNSLGNGAAHGDCRRVSNVTREDFTGKFILRELSKRYCQYYGFGDGKALSLKFEPSDYKRENLNGPASSRPTDYYVASVLCSVDQLPAD